MLLQSGIIMWFFFFNLNLGFIFVAQDRSFRRTVLYTHQDNGILGWHGREGCRWDSPSCCAHPVCCPQVSTSKFCTSSRSVQSTLATSLLSQLERTQEEAPGSSSTHKLHFQLTLACYMLSLGHAEFRWFLPPLVIVPDLCHANVGLSCSSVRILDQS